MMYNGIKNGQDKGKKEQWGENVKIEEPGMENKNE